MEREGEGKGEVEGEREWEGEGEGKVKAMAMGRRVGSIQSKSSGKAGELRDGSGEMR